MSIQFSIPNCPTKVDYLATSVADNGATIPIVNKPSLSQVAFSGSYNDLLAKPTVPTSVDYTAASSTATTLAVINRPTTASPLTLTTSALSTIDNGGNNSVQTATLPSTDGGTVSFFNSFSRHVFVHGWYNCAAPVTLDTTGFITLQRFGTALRTWDYADPSKGFTPGNLNVVGDRPPGFWSAIGNNPTFGDIVGQQLNNSSSDVTYPINAITLPAGKHEFRLAVFNVVILGNSSGASPVYRFSNFQNMLPYLSLTDYAGSGALFQNGGVATQKAITAGGLASTGTLTVAGTSTLSGGATAANGLMVTGPPSAARQQIPTAAMTSNTSEEGFIASASSPNPNVLFQPWKAFNKTAAGETWASAIAYTVATGAYAGTVTTTVSGTAVAGEWLQLQTPVPYRLSSYTVTDSVGRQKQWTVAGSQDGLTWTLIDSRNLTTVPTATTTYIPPGTVGVFSFYRYIVQANVPNTGSTTDLGELWYTGFPYVSAPLTINGALNVNAVPGTAHNLGNITSNPSSTARTFTTLGSLGYNGTTPSTPTVGANIAVTATPAGYRYLQFWYYAKTAVKVEPNDMLMNLNNTGSQFRSWDYINGPAAGFTLSNLTPSGNFDQTVTGAYVGFVNLPFPTFGCSDPNNPNGTIIPTTYYGPANSFVNVYALSFTLPAGWHEFRMFFQGNESYLVMRNSLSFNNVYSQPPAHVLSGTVSVPAPMRCTELDVRRLTVGRPMMWHYNQTTNSATTAGAASLPVTASLFTLSPTASTRDAVFSVGTILGADTPTTTSSDKAGVTIVIPFSGIYALTWMARFLNGSGENSMWFVTFATATYVNNDNMRRIGYNSTSSVSLVTNFTGYFTAGDKVVMNAYSGGANQLITALGPHLTVALLYRTS